METHWCTPLLFSSVAWHAPRPPATPATKPCCSYLVAPRPGARRRHEKRKSKTNRNLPPKRQDSQVSLESPAAFSRPPPTSSTGLWQTRSERKPWNQRRKPREAYHQRGSAYEPEQQLASSCHVAATSQCISAVPDDSSLFVLHSLSRKTFLCPRPKHIAGHMTNPSTHQHNLASAVFVKNTCSEKQTFVNRPWKFQLFIQEG